MAVEIVSKQWERVSKQKATALGFRRFNLPVPTESVNNFVDNLRNEMQEPTRLNLLNVLQKNLKLTDRKTYLHRCIYIGDFSTSSIEDIRLIQLIFESNIKLINDEFAEAPLTGFGLFYDGYFINIIEGSEECLAKHLRTLTESIGENLSISPMVNRMKMLIMSHHIMKRDFFNWFGRPANPPVLLEKIDATTDPEQTIRQINVCVKKLLKMSEFLKSQPVGLIRATMDNISDVCQQYLPEVNLLEFLLDSPALISIPDTIKTYGTVPEPSFVEELIWPIPTDFVPYNVIGKDKSKVFMYMPKESVDEPAEKREDT